MTPQRLEPRPERPQHRTLLIAIALAIIALFSGLGIAYLDLWQRASEDLTRLLPSATRAYAQVPRPWANMLDALARAPMRERSTARERIQRDSYLLSPASADLGGLPLDVARDILRAARGLELAVVPSGSGDSLMAFVELDDSPQRRRILSRIRPNLETVDRHAGFRIDRARAHEWSRYLGLSPLRPRLVEMPPWLIFAWGNPQALEDLLDARVGGIHESIHRRPGFVEHAPLAEEPGLRLVVDATSAWRLLVDEPSARPGGLVEQLDLLTIEHHTEGFRDSLRLDAEIADAAFATSLANAFQAATDRPSLASLGPANALAVLTFSSPRLDTLVQTLATLDFALRRDFAPSARPSGLSTALRTSPDRLPQASADVAIFLLPSAGGLRPLVLLRTDAPDALQRALVGTWPSLFGDEFAHGEVMLDGTPVYIERPEVLEYGSADGLAWRYRDGLFEFALDPTTLRDAASPERLASVRPFDAAAHGLAPHAISFLARAELLERLDPFGPLLRSRIESDAWLGVSLDIVDSHFELRSTFGLWPLLASVVTASRDELDALTLASLPSACRERMRAFCALYPYAIPCRPLATDRRERIDELCDAPRSSP